MTNSVHVVLCNALVELVYEMHGTNLLEKGKANPKTTGLKRVVT